MTAFSGRSYTLADLAEQVGGTVVGDGSVSLHGVATLAGAQADQISFLTNPKYTPQLRATAAGAVIVPEKSVGDVPGAAMVVSNPHAAFARIAQLFDTTPAVSTDIAESAVIADSAQLGANVSLGPHVVIGADAVLGDNVAVGANTVIGKGASIGSDCTVYPNVTIYHDVMIGNGVTIHAQTVIGSDGFGHANDRGTWLPIPQTGTVRIGDNTHIGASTTIDRGAMDDTVIGTNVIIDNQVQIAHNCIIGDHTCICGSTGIAGSCHIGKHVVIAGSVAINGHISICDNVQITGFSMIVQDITEPGVYSSGQPAMPNREWRKNVVRLRQVDSLFQRVKALENNRR